MYRKVIQLYIYTVTFLVYLNEDEKMGDISYYFFSWISE